VRQATFGAQVLSLEAPRAATSLAQRQLRRPLDRLFETPHKLTKADPERPAESPQLDYVIKPDLSRLDA
jgi:hypothetical protein